MCLLVTETEMWTVSTSEEGDTMISVSAREERRKELLQGLLVVVNQLWPQFPSAPEKKERPLHLLIPVKQVCSL